MNISGIRPYSGYNLYRPVSGAESTQTVSTDLATQQAQKQDTAESIPSSVSQNTPQNQTFGAYDYANQYNPDSTYEMKGKESDLKSLDVENAISSMQKDSLLHQYQYFVGADQTAAQGTQGETPNARATVENFSL